MFNKRFIKENKESDIAIIELRRCFIIKWHVARRFFWLVKESVFKKQSVWPRIKLEALSFMSLFKNRLTIIKGDNLYFVCNFWSSGYYHFVTEVWRKLLIFNDELVNGTVLISSSSPKFIKESLDLFGIKSVRVFDGNCFVNKIKIISNPIIRSPNNGEIQAIREFVFSKFKIVEGESIEKIYISRKKARARKVANEVEIKKILLELGFYYVELEDMPLEKQINLFRQCRQLVSIHGAGLVNSIFMPIKSQVIELYPKSNSPISECYLTLSKLIGIEHRFFFCERADKNKGEDLYKDDIVVDPKLLRSYLRSIELAPSK